MPGIYGILTGKKCESAEKEFTIMSEAVAHENFYNSGKYINHKMGVYVGWTCQKDIFTDCMPVFNEKEDVILVYYGEDYRDITEIDELKGKNHVFDKTNASYIVHMYEEWGESFLVKLNGRFHGLLIDTRKKISILFNDRYGARRINYFKDKDAFYFSAEATAIVKSISHLCQMNMDGLAEMFVYNSISGDRTLFENIFLLPGASAYSFNIDHGVEEKLYYDPSDLVSQTLLEKEFFYEKFRHTFQKSVQRYVRTGGKIGVNLPGTLDTRILLSNLQCSSDRYHFYSYGNHHDDTPDLADARSIAATFKQILHEYMLDENFADSFPSYAEKAVYLSDGTMNITGAVDLYLDQCLTEYARNKISPAYGSAVLRNANGIYLNSINKTYFTADFQEIMAAKLMRQNNNNCKSHINNIYRSIACNHGLMAINEYQFVVKTPYIDNEIVKLMFRAPDDVIDTSELSLRLWRDGNGKLATVEHNKMKRNCKLNPVPGLLDYIHGYLFRTADRSQTARCMDGLYNNLKHARINDYCNRSALFQQYSARYRNRIAGFIKELLLDSRSTSRNYIVKCILEKAVLESLNGTGAISLEICLLATAELFSRLFIDRK